MVSDMIQTMQDRAVALVSDRGPSSRDENEGEDERLLVSGPSLAGFPGTIGKRGLTRRQQEESRRVQHGPVLVLVLVPCPS